MIFSFALSLAVIVTPIISEARLQRIANRIPYCNARVIVKDITETKLVNGEHKGIAGLAIRETKEIHIDHKANISTLYHECGHFIKWNAPNYPKYYFDKPPYLRDYSEVKGEDFPDSVAAYYQNPDSLSRKKRLAIKRLLDTQN